MSLVSPSNDQPDQLYLDTNFFLKALFCEGYFFVCPFCKELGVQCSFNRGSYCCKKCQTKFCYVCGNKLENDLHSLYHWKNTHYNKTNKFKPVIQTTKTDYYKKKPNTHQILFLTAQTCFLEFEKTDTIGQVKSRVAQVTTCTKIMQRLIWCGKGLENQRRLCDYGINNSKPFHNVLRLENQSTKVFYTITDQKTQDLNLSQPSQYRLPYSFVNDFSKEKIFKHIEKSLNIKSSDQIWLAYGIRIDNLPQDFIKTILAYLGNNYYLVLKKCQYGQIDPEFGIALELSDFYQQKEFSDIEINKFKAHSQILYARTRIEPNRLKHIFETILTNKEIELFLDWIYGSLPAESNPKILKLWEKVQNEHSKMIKKKTVTNKQNNKGNKNENEKENENEKGKGKEFKDLPKQKKQGNFEQITKLRSIKEDFEWLYKQDTTKDFSIIVQNEEEENESNYDENNDEDELENESISVHSIILLIRSGLFRDLFRNVKNLKNSVKDFSNISDHSLEILIRFFYTNEINLTADEDPILFLEETSNVFEYYQLSKCSPFDILFSEMQMNKMKK
ncbi:polyubiquitin [Anaeramoeba flamelloides]|uniref:Polyubiquitin n=1 Tax=Anaeramoeba flamelloides TaxID=1746091 RepID=A0AAV8AEV6_9EUKA|nr:polyubiquitin [Anaeramoeba flamelloides]